MALRFDPRYTSLVFSAVAAIAAGTPYLYGVYAPQLVQRCQISAESAATISFASNVGSAIGGFPAGVIIDKYGVKFSLVLGAVSVFLGYGSLHLCYKYALSSLMLLSVSIMFVGFGSITSYYSTLKVCTSNFPHSKGTAGAFAVSSFGLSALVFSAIASYFFTDNSQDLLRFLSLFCGATIAISSLFIRLYEKEEIDRLDGIFDEENAIVGPAADLPPLGHVTQPQDIETPKTSMNPFLSGHRGSFAAINFNESTTSLFSYASSLMSRSSSSVSSFSASPTKNQAIQVPSSTINNINNTYYNSSPTLSRLSGSPSTVSSTSPQDIPRSMHHHRNSSFKGVVFGLGAGSSPGDNSSPAVPERSVQKRDSNDTPPAVNEETPLIETNIVKKRTRTSPKEHTPMGHAKNLITDRAFLLHYLILGLLSAIGQLYIYSVGFIVRALFDKADATAASIPGTDHFVAYLLKHRQFAKFLGSFIVLYDPAQASGYSVQSTDPTAEAYQALQVSILAFGSFSGRLIWGPISDLSHKTYKYQRLWLVLVSNALLVSGQIATLYIDNVSTIWVSSILLGVGYGSIFSVYPAIIAEQFGSKGFTTSWGLICTGPLLVLFFLTKVFGQNIDRMSEWIDGRYICIVGRKCYDEIFKIDIGLCAFVALMMLGLIYQRRTM